MSRENTPTDNSVAERFMRTFKQHQIYGKNIYQTIEEAILSDPEFKSYKSVFNLFVKSINRTPNSKSFLKSPKRHDMDVSTASIFMEQPLHPKAFSERFGADFRRNLITDYKNENVKIIKLLEEFAARKAQVVNKTPFDNNNRFEDNLALELIESHLKELYSLIQSNQYIIQQSVEKSVENFVEPVNENIDDLREQFLDEMETLNRKLDTLLPKKRNKCQIQPLRYPVYTNLFPIFLSNAGESFSKRQDLKRAQIRIAYNILYHTGLRINEIRHLQQKDIRTAIDAAQYIFNLYL